MDFKNKVALITGSATGIGKEVAILLAKYNCNLILNYNTSLNEAINLKKELENKYQIKIILVKADITNESEIKKMVETSILAFGKIDILINNAGIAIDTTFEDKTKANFLKILDTNLVGPFLLSKYVGKYMLENKYGKIVNVASTNGIDTNYVESLDYDASKAGLISLTKNLACYYAPYINVNAVAPGWVDTPMNKELDKSFIEKENKKILLNRFASPEEIAKVIVFLASDEASYINSEIIRVDGGYNNG